LKLDSEALFSTTDQVTADKITKDILRYVSRTATITDATACIGGSAFSFAQNFRKIIAIEYDKTRFDYLQYNMNLLLSSTSAASTSNLDNKDIEKKEVECRNGDAIIECTKQNQDVIFIDPPWGGPEYKTLPCVKLYLSGLQLYEVCNQIHKYTHYIVLKVPVNFDEEGFIIDTASFMQLIYRNYQLRKMHLLIF
jgi:tRNA/tmRNA/rRNA uracil-C5-methylase (TrmA/RlmC/RlmD family)